MSRSLSKSDLVWVSFKSIDHQAWILETDESDGEVLVQWEMTGLTDWVPQASITQELPLTRRRKTKSTFCSFEDFENPKMNSLWKQVTIGSRIAVKEDEEDDYYNATVVKQKRKRKFVFRLEYDKDEDDKKSQTEWLDLSQQPFALLSPTSTSTEAETSTWNGISIGSRIAIYWKEDKKFYPATVVPFSLSGKNPSLFCLHYDDGEVEQLDLSQHDYQLLSTSTEDGDDSKKQQNLSQLAVGSRISVYWKDDAMYYPATVQSKVKRGSSIHCNLEYDDGETEYQVDLNKEVFRLLEKTKDSAIDPPPPLAAASVKPNNASFKRKSMSPPNEQSKRRKHARMEEAAIIPVSPAKRPTKAILKKTTSPKVDTKQPANSTGTNVQEKKKLISKKLKRLKLKRVQEHNDDKGKTHGKPTAESKASKSATVTQLEEKNCKEPKTASAAAITTQPAVSKASNTHETEYTPSRNNILSCGTTQLGMKESNSAAAAETKQGDMTVDGTCLSFSAAEEDCATKTRPSPWKECKRTLETIRSPLNKYKKSIIADEPFQMTKRIIIPMKSISSSAATSGFHTYATLKQQLKSACHFEPKLLNEKQVEDKNSLVETSSNDDSSSSESECSQNNGNTSGIQEVSEALLPVPCTSAVATELLLEKNRLLRKRLTGPRKKRILKGYEMDLSSATA